MKRQPTTHTQSLRNLSTADLERTLGGSLADDLDVLINGGVPIVPGSNGTGDRTACAGKDAERQAAESRH